MYTHSALSKFLSFLVFPSFIFYFLVFFTDVHKNSDRSFVLEIFPIIQALNSSLPKFSPALFYWLVVLPTFLYFGLISCRDDSILDGFIRYFAFQYSDGRLFILLNGLFDPSSFLTAFRRFYP